MRTNKPLLFWMVFINLCAVIKTNKPLDDNAGQTHEQLLEKYNLGHVWSTLREHRFDDVSLWLDIDEQIWKNMNLLDSDRIRFKKLQNELRNERQSTVEKSLKMMSPIITFCIQNIKIVAAIVSGFVFPAIIWLYNKLANKQKVNQIDKLDEPATDKNVPIQKGKRQKSCCDRRKHDSSKKELETTDVLEYVELESGEYQFQLSGSNKAIDIEGHYNKVGAYLILKDLNDDDMTGYANHQIFHVKKQEDCYFVVQNRNSALFWKIDGLKNNVRLTQCRFGGSTNQMFRCVKSERGYFIQAKHSAKYLSVSGTKIVQSDTKQPFVCRKIP